MATRAQYTLVCDLCGAEGKSSDKADAVLPEGWGIVEIFRMVPNSSAAWTFAMSAAAPPAPGGLTRQFVVPGLGVKTECCPTCIGAFVAAAHGCRNRTKR